MGKWTNKTLNGFVRKGTTLTSTSMCDGEYPVVAGGLDYAGVHNVYNRLEKCITISASGANAGAVRFHKTKIFATDCSTVIWNYCQEYLYYELLRRQQQIFRMQTGLAQPHIYPRDIEKIEVHYPKSLTEQKKIAEILMTIDEAIEKTCAIIEKYTMIKQGLMQDLLSKGKNILLKKVAKVKMGQSPNNMSVNSDGYGIAFLQGNGEFGYKNPQEIFWCTQPKKIALVGALLISVRAPVGDVNIANKDYCIGRGLATINFWGIDKTYAYYLLKKSIKQLHLVSQGTTFLAVNKNDIENMILRISPKLSTQIEIANQLTTADDKIQSERDYLVKLENIKSGLMQDLLTNKVKVDKLLKERI